MRGDEDEDGGKTAERGLRECVIVQGLRTIQTSRAHRFCSRGERGL